MVVYPLFKWLTTFLIRRHFRKVVLNGTYADQGNPILIVANHVSWWDGFWIVYLNKMVLHRKFHFMMQEEQLRKYWYFRYSGAYSIKKGTRSVLESLDYTVNILQKSKNMVFIFPQGAIGSMYNDHIKFESGIERIIRKAPANLEVLFVANFVDYFSHPKPDLFIYFASHKWSSAAEYSIETAYTAFYNSVLQLQKIKTS